MPVKPATIRPRGVQSPTTGTVAAVSVRKATPSARACADQSVTSKSRPSRGRPPTPHTRAPAAGRHPRSRPCPRPRRGPSPARLRASTHTPKPHVRRACAEKPGSGLELCWCGLRGVERDRPVPRGARRIRPGCRKPSVAIGESSIAAPFSYETPVTSPGPRTVTSRWAVPERQRRDTGSFHPGPAAGRTTGARQRAKSLFRDCISARYGYRPEREGER